MFASFLGPSRWTLSLACLLLAASAFAGRFELLSEWRRVPFKDGSRDLIRYVHMPDIDVPEVEGARGGRAQLYVPLYELALREAVKGSDGDAQSLTLESRPTNYKLSIKLDEKGRHLIKRPPDFETEALPETTTPLSQFGLKAANPQYVLLIVKQASEQEPPRPPTTAPSYVAAAAPASYSDIEMAAMAGMDAPRRAAAVAQCGAESSVGSAAACWKGQVQQALSAHEDEGPGHEFSVFEQRYLKERLSPKSYQQFQRVIGLPEADSGRSALLKDWHKVIILHDIHEEARANPAQAPHAAAPAKAPLSAAQAAYSEIERAGIGAMDASERAQALSQCRAEPFIAGASDCWRAEVKRLLRKGGTSFEQRYLKRRLSGEAFKEFQAVMALPDKNPRRIAKLNSWRVMMAEDARGAPSQSGPAPAAAKPAKLQKAPPPEPEAPVREMQTRPSPLPSAAPRRSFRFWAFLALAGAAGLALAIRRGGS